MVGGVAHHWVEVQQMLRLNLPAARWSVLFLRGAKPVNEMMVGWEPAAFAVRVVAESANNHDRLEVVGQVHEPDLPSFLLLAEREISKRLHSADWISGKVYGL